MDDGFCTFSSTMNLLRSSRSLAAKSRQGYSLVEVAVVAVVISVLTTAVFFMVQGETDRSRVASVAKTARIINEAASVYRLEHGVWPRDRDNSIVPPEIANSLPPNLFTRDVAIGGRWDWNGPGGSMSITGVSIRYATVADANIRMLQLLDGLIDDGSLSSGRAYTVNHGPRLHYLFSVE